MSISGLVILIIHLSGLKKIAVVLVYLLIDPPSLYFVLLVVFNQKVIIRDVTSSVRHFLTKRYATQLPRRIQLPNVYSAR